MNLRTHTLAFVMAAPLAALAQTPPNPAYLERAQVLAADNEIKIYRLPAKDSTGKIKYWDVTIALVINTWGRPEATATVVSVASPKFSGSDFVAGTYKDVFGNPCTVTTAFLDGGRQEMAFNCGLSTGSAVNGPIASHPFELDLTAANIGAIPGYENYSWGRMGWTNGTVWTCFNNNEIVSARQIGSQIVLTDCGFDNITDCGMTLTLQP